MPTESDKLFTSILELDSFEGLTGAITLEASGDMLGGITIKNMVFDCGSRACRDDADAAAGRKRNRRDHDRDRDRRYVTLSETRATFESVGSYIPGEEGLTMFGDKSIIYAGPTKTKPNDIDPISDAFAYEGTLTAVIAISVVFVLILAVFGLVHHRKVSGLKEEVSKLGKTLVGVRHVTSSVDYGSMGIEAPPAAGDTSQPSLEDAYAAGLAEEDEYAAGLAEEDEYAAGLAEEEKDADTYLDFGNPETLAVTEPDKPDKLKLQFDNSFRWYWQEESDRIDSHNTFDVLQPGNWVSYAWGVSSELDYYFDQWQAKTGPKSVDLDLTDRIASTGNEAKAHGAESGVGFTIDFEHMTQKNAQSGFVRAMSRVAVKAAPSFLGSPTSQEYNGFGETNGEGDVFLEWKKDNPITKIPTGLPADLAALPDFKLLNVKPGQLVQQQDVRPDGWALGTVIFDPTADAAVATKPAPKASISIRYDDESGWFPLACTEMANNKHMAKFQAQMGSGVADALAAPAHWEAVRDVQVAERFELKDGPEKAKAVAAFKASLLSHVTIVGVQRIQNMAMYQSYAIKRQAMINRDKDTKDNKWWDNNHPVHTNLSTPVGRGGSPPPFHADPFMPKDCPSCNESKGKGKFTDGEWKKNNGLCRACLDKCHHCPSCNESKGKGKFTDGEWQKNNGLCRACLDHHTSTSAAAAELTPHMTVQQNDNVAGNIEKTWLFHGTAAGTVPLIIQQGFNRIFAGKNATMYGKGVYFAKNASYSASRTYSPPDSKGVQQMFLCRVLTGYSCKGVKDQLVPNTRDAKRHILYDTTTNSDKSIFVTYHDAQQYPEYLIRFK